MGRMGKQVGPAEEEELVAVQACAAQASACPLPGPGTGHNSLHSQWPGRLELSVASWPWPGTVGASPAASPTIQAHQEKSFVGGRLIPSRVYVLANRPRDLTASSKFLRCRVFWDVQRRLLAHLVFGTGYHRRLTARTHLACAESVFAIPPKSFRMIF